MSLSTDPRDLLLGDDDDLVVTADLAFARGLSGVAQDCESACGLCAEEWFLDLDAGIDYFNKIFGVRARVGLINAKSEFRRELLLVADVVEVLQLDATFDGVQRQLSIVLTVRTLFGDTPQINLVFTGGA